MLILSIAIPAQAEEVRTLPTGDALYAISCDGSVEVPKLQLLSLDPATGASTTIGAPGFNTSGYCAAQAAWDPSTQTAYFLGWINGTSRLNTMNLTTGAVEQGVALKFQNENVNVQTIAISEAGVIYAISDGSLYTATANSGELALVGPVTPAEIYGLTFAPDGILYGLNYVGALYEIDPGTGASTLIAELQLTPSSAPETFQIDSSGILWIQNDSSVNNGGSDLWSVDVAADPVVATLSGSTHLAETSTYYYTESLLIVRAPTVAPAITSAPSASATVGTELRFPVSATGTPNPTFTATGTLPAGVTLDRITGILSGTPTAAGTYSFIITATNSANHVDQTFTLTIANAAPHLPVTGG